MIIKDIADSSPIVTQALNEAKAKGGDESIINRRLTYMKLKNMLYSEVGWGSPTKELQSERAWGIVMLALLDALNL